jgi:exportin-7
VIRLEALCKELYESQDAGARAEAEKALVSFQNSPESLGKFHKFMELTF